jgi:hypothetical protein
MENSKPRAKRYNKGKVRYELIPSNFLRELAMVYTRGAHKYSVYRDEAGNTILGKDIPFEESHKYEMIEDGADNWRLGQAWMSTYSSLNRHLEAWKSGEDIDPDPTMQTSHLMNAVWGLATLEEYRILHPNLDNRVKPKLPKVGFDIDGVLADYVGSYLSYFDGMDKTLPVYWNDWRFFNPEFTKEIKENKHFWLSIPPLIDPTTLKFEPVCYVTARSIPEEWTREWLSINKFPYAPIVSVNGKSKVEALSKFTIDYYIDDHYENFVDLNNAGIPTFLFTQSHNVKYDVGQMRLNNINDILNGNR